MYINTTVLSPQLFLQVLYTCTNKPRMQWYCDSVSTCTVHVELHVSPSSKNNRIMYMYMYIITSVQRTNL